MATFLGILGFIVLVTVIVLIRRLTSKAGAAFWKQANRKVLNRTGHERGQDATRAKMEFLVPGVPAAQVINIVLRELDLSEQPPLVFVRELVVARRGADFVEFASANKAFRAFESLLAVKDEGGEARGTYEVIRWKLADGITMDWKEMEVLAGRIQTIVTQMGGRVRSVSKLSGGDVHLPSIGEPAVVCLACGGSFPQGARFCPYCGRPT